MMNNEIYARLSLDSVDENKSGNIFHIRDVVQKVMSFLPASNLLMFMQINKTYHTICKKLLQRPGVGNASLTVSGRRMSQTSFLKAVDQTILLALDRIGSIPNIAIIFCTPLWGTKSISLPSDRFEKVLRARLNNCEILGGISTGIIGTLKSKQDSYEVETKRGVSITLIRLPTKAKVFLCRSYRNPERCILEFNGRNTESNLTVPKGGKKQWAGAFVLLSTEHRGMIDALQEWLECPIVGCITSQCTASNDSDWLTAAFVKPSGRSISYASGREEVDAIAGLAFKASPGIAFKTSCSEGLEPITEPLPIVRVRNLEVTDISIPHPELQHTIRSFHAVGFQFADKPAVHMGFSSEGKLYIPQQLVQSKNEMPQSVRFFVTSNIASKRDINRRLTVQRKVMAEAGFKPIGGLLFQCSNRGKQYYGKPDVETNAFFRSIGGHSNLGGCFCNREIGPNMIWSPNNMPIVDDEHNSIAIHTYTSFGIIYYNPGE